MADKRNQSPWLKETSDQSGFDNFGFDGTTFHKKWRSIKQNDLTIAPDEFDTPPPSTKPLGGADISGSPRINSLTTTVPSGFDITIQYVTAAGGITSSLVPLIYVAGSNTAIDITANPQVSVGKAQQIIGIQCVGSNITLDDGTGLALTADQSFVMTSGSIINFIYSATDNLWHETSRIQNGGI